MLIDLVPANNSKSFFVIISHPVIQWGYVFFRQFFGDFKLFFVFPVAVLPFVCLPECAVLCAGHLGLIAGHDGIVLAVVGIVRTSRASRALETPFGVAVAVHDAVGLAVCGLVGVVQPEDRTICVHTVLARGVARLGRCSYPALLSAHTHDVEIAIV